MNRLGAKVIGAFIDALTWDSALSHISNWAAKRESSYVCICNVHSVISTHQDNAFGLVVAEADMVTPDGAPVAWMLKRLGFPNQQRINGPDLMWKYCELAASRSEAIFLYGGMQETLTTLQARLQTVFPGLKIAGSYSPPFRALTAEEDIVVVEMINASGAGTVWISLGCPKQELWMAAHRGSINAVMIGVGAAFNFHAETIIRAPKWMQEAGLEWLHRLAADPGRLWKRYLVTNTLFILLAAKQLVVKNAKTRLLPRLKWPRKGVN